MENYKREVFRLMTKPSHQGERGEVINRCEAASLGQAILIFAEQKRLKPADLIKIYNVV